jgi:hypothetical protein
MCINPSWSHAYPYPPLIQERNVEVYDQPYAQFGHCGNDILSFKIIYLFYDHFNFFLNHIRYSKTSWWFRFSIRRKRKKTTKTRAARKRTGDKDFRVNAKILSAATLSDVSSKMDAMYRKKTSTLFCRLYRVHIHHFSIWLCFYREYRAW